MKYDDYLLQGRDEGTPQPYVCDFCHGETDETTGVIDAAGDRFDICPDCVESHEIVKLTDAVDGAIYQVMDASVYWDRKKAMEVVRETLKKNRNGKLDI